MTLTISYDEKADVLYLRLGESNIVESEEVKPGIVLDFNAKNQVVGIELLNLKGAGVKQLEIALPDEPA